MKKGLHINYVDGNRNNEIIPIDCIVQFYTFLDDVTDYILHIVTKKGAIDIAIEDIECIDVVNIYEE